MKRKSWVLAVVAVTITGCGATPAEPEAPATTVPVQWGELSSMVSQKGTLTYRARSDGSPYTAINQARGIYTKLPKAGDQVDCGDVLYRVDDDPVLLLCGAVPAYRDLRIGKQGKDVRQLQRNLRALGDPTIKALQRRKGLAATGTLDFGDVVFLPKPVRIAKVTAELGGFARPGAAVAQATSDTLEVQVDLEPSQQGEVRPGDRAQITLPDLKSVPGKVARLGRVAESAEKDAAATIPASISLDEPRQASGLDKAPVQVDITTKGVERALSVPVTALVGKSGGGFAVEVVRDDGRRDLVAVKLGLFDTAGGRVEVAGKLVAGDHVVVPAL